MIGRYLAGLDPGGATGVLCHFDTPSSITSSPTFIQETVNIIGAATAVVRLQITVLDNTNRAGECRINGVEKFLNYAFNVTLDGSGNGSFVWEILGDPTDIPTAISARISIESVSIGAIGTPNIIDLAHSFR